MLKSRVLCSKVSASEPASNSSVWLASPLMRGYQARQSMNGAANAFAGQHAHALAVQIRKLRFDMLWHARQAVARVVDQDVHFEPVDGLEIGHRLAPLVDDVGAQYADAGDLDFEHIAGPHP
jgi:hypothetical protein